MKETNFTIYNEHDVCPNCMNPNMKWKHGQIYICLKCNFEFRNEMRVREIENIVKSSGISPSLISSPTSNIKGETKE